VGVMGSVTSSGKMYSDKRLPGMREVLSYGESLWNLINTAPSN
jgi:hypothetical protein